MKVRRLWSWVFDDIAGSFVWTLVTLLYLILGKYGRSAMRDEIRRQADDSALELWRALAWLPGVGLVVSEAQCLLDETPRPLGLGGDLEALWVDTWRVTFRQRLRDFQRTHNVEDLIEVLGELIESQVALDALDLP